jgi:hypothetical protein
MFQLIKKKKKLRVCLAKFLELVFASQLSGFSNVAPTTNTLFKTNHKTLFRKQKFLQNTSKI